MSPEIRITAYLLFVILVFLVQDMRFYAVMFLALTVFLIRVPFQSLKKGWIPIMLFLLFTFMGNALFEQGRILFQAGPLVLTDEGISAALHRTTRVCLLIFGAKVLTSTTNIALLIRACGNILKPLERLHLPVREFFSIMGLTMQSLPLLKKQLTDTYRSRVSDEKITGFWNRAKAVSQFLMPLFVKTLQSPEVFFQEESVKEEKQN